MFRSKGYLQVPSVSTPAMTDTPAFWSPYDSPPAPQNRSTAVILDCTFDIRLI